MNVAIYMPLVLPTQTEKYGSMDFLLDLPYGALYSLNEYCRCIKYNIVLIL